jgi:hypothetical protein
MKDGKWILGHCNKFDDEFSVQGAVVVDGLCLYLVSPWLSAPLHRTSSGLSLPDENPRCDDVGLRQVGRQAGRQCALSPSLSSQTVCVVISGMKMPSPFSLYPPARTHRKAETTNIALHYTHGTFIRASMTR